MTTTNNLVSVAITIASVGAEQYLRAHNLTATPEALCQCLRAWVEVQLPIALKDAKEALDCNMCQVAEATFKASLIQAGIEAAKETGVPAN